MVDRLDLQALRAGYEVAEAGLHVAVLEQFPNLSITLAGARDTANNWTVGPQVGFTLPLWNRNRGNIAIASATREQLKAEYEARLFQTRAEIAAAVAGIASEQHQKADLLSQMPALSRYAEATRRAAQRGDLSKQQRMLLRRQCVTASSRSLNLISKSQSNRLLLNFCRAVSAKDGRNEAGSNDPFSAAACRLRQRCQRFYG